MYYRFLGHYTSSIQFDRVQQLWRWLDMKDGASVATRNVLISLCANVSGKSYKRSIGEVS